MNDVPRAFCGKECCLPPLLARALQHVALDFRHKGVNADIPVKVLENSRENPAVLEALNPDFAIGQSAADARRSG